MKIRLCLYLQEKMNLSLIVNRSEVSSTNLKQKREYIVKEEMRFGYPLNVHLLLIEIEKKVHKESTQLCWWQI